MKHDICTFLAECDICQRDKGEIVKTPDTLQQIKLPPTIWTHIFMNLIVGLPKLGNTSFITAVVDRLSKNSHLCYLQHPFTPFKVAQMFIDNIFKLHGMLDSIVSNRDPSFTNNF